MVSKLQNAKKLISIATVMGICRVLSALGRSKQAMRLIGRYVNSRHWKSPAFAGYQPTEQDVFVATFAKSGTNWMLQIAQQIAPTGSAEFAHIHDVVPWPDAPFPEIRARLSDCTTSQFSPTGLRIIKTHYDRAFVPFNERAKYITVIRDPKEMVVSSFYFAKDFFDILGVTYDFEQWLAAAMRPSFLFGDWAAHTASWWAVRNESNMFVVTYSDLKRNPAELMEQISWFMGVQLTPEQLTSVVERSSFAWMKAHESRFQALMPPRLRRERRPLMMRNGQSGKSGELLSASQQFMVDKFFRTRLKQLSSDFPYDEMFQSAI